jgi:FixJ family two-component response regulator
MTREALARVHIVDDDELVRARMSYALSNHGYSTEIYTGGPEFFRDGNLKRGCILLDLRMPQMSGHEVLEELARLGSALPVVVMSAYGDLRAVVRAMKLGAVDFIEKPAGEEDLLAAVGRALTAPGKSEIRRNVTIAAAARLNRLSPRERQILQGLLDGLSNKGIARRLGLSPRTVEMHRASLKGELGVRSLSETVQFAIDAALTPLSEMGRHESRP